MGRKWTTADDLRGKVGRKARDMAAANPSRVHLVEKLPDEGKAEEVEKARKPKPMKQ